MTNDTILTRFDDLNTWEQGDQRAPHKPLLVLYALGRWQQGKAEVTFKEAEPELTALLREFGQYRKSDHPEQPFWRLQKDGVWMVKAPADLPLITADEIPKIGALRSPEVSGHSTAAGASVSVPGSFAFTSISAHPPLCGLVLWGCNPTHPASNLRRWCGGDTCPAAAC
jgi:hypothetical protein